MRQWGLGNRPSLCLALRAMGKDNITTEAIKTCMALCKNCSLCLKLVIIMAQGKIQFIMQQSIIHMAGSHIKCKTQSIPSMRGVCLLWVWGDWVGLTK